MDPDSDTHAEPSETGGTPSEVPGQDPQPQDHPEGVWVHASNGPRVRRPHDAIQSRDFRNPTVFSAAVLRRLRLRHDEFIRALSARLSLYLRMEFSLRLSSLTTTSYRNLVAGFADPTHLTLFRVDPLPGICLVDVPPRMAMTVVDRLLGGPAQALTTDHSPSEIELALLNQAVHVILAEWAAFWSGAQELKAVTLGYENNARYLKTSPHDTAMVVLTMDARLGECEEPIQIVFPHYTLEPLIPFLSQSPDKSATNALPTSRQEKPPWNPLFADVPVSVVAQWEGIELTARQIAQLKIGDIVPLDASCVEEVKVRLANTARFKGRLGAAGDHLAVELTGTWKP